MMRPHPLKYGWTVALALLAVTLTAALFFADAHAAAKRVLVTGIRHWSNPDYTRIVVSLDGKAPYTYRLLKEDESIGKPRRLYVDFSGALVSKGLEKNVPINDGLLVAARAGQHDGKTARVVLDIASIEEYKVFSLSDPYRVVIDITGKGKGAAEPPAAAEAAPTVQPTPPTPLPQAAPLPQPAAKDAVAPPAPLKESAPATRPGGKAAAKAGPKGGKERVIRIVLDPGHGGKDPGAVGKLGLKEKDVTLRLSRLVKEKLKDRVNARIVTTRDKDVFVPLEERTAIANSVDADLFVSIHVNASRKRKSSGMETYILNVADDEESRRLAARENATSRKAVTDLEFILNDLMRNAKHSDSARLAMTVQGGMVARAKGMYGDVKSNGVKGAPFYVLVGTRMPAVLVEVSFISNPVEEKRLRDEKYIRTLADGIVEGIVKYLNGGASAPI